MKLRSPVLVATLAVIASAVPASAATIKLTMNAGVDPSIKSVGNIQGVEGFAAIFPAPKVQVYEATVTDDAGVVVENACLANGARIELVDGSLAVRGGASCTNSSGKWQFVLTGTRLIAPGELTAQLLAPATTIDGRVLSPASSNQVVLVLAPKLTDTSPIQNTGASYPVSGYVTMPAKLRAKGTVRLEKKVAGKWVLLGSKTTDSSGRYRFSIRYGTRGKTSVFRVRFIPPKNIGWIPMTDNFTITWA